MRPCCRSLFALVVLVVFETVNSDVAYRLQRSTEPGDLCTKPVDLVLLYVNGHCRLLSVVIADAVSLGASIALAISSNTAASCGTMIDGSRSNAARSGGRPSVGF